MDNKLTQKLNELDGGKYGFLKLSCVNIYKKEQIAEIIFIYPEKQEKQVNEERVNIEGIIAKIIDIKLKLRIRLVKSCFFNDIFVDELIAFFEAFPSVYTNVRKENIIISENQGAKKIEIELPLFINDYAESSGILQKAKEFFSYKYSDELLFSFKISEEIISETENIENFAKKITNNTTQLEKEGGRFITVNNREEFIGPIIYDDATYIADAKISDKVILCGKIEEYTIIARKPKSPEETSDKKFYKFKLRDFTGIINCLYFPTQKTENTIINLNDGKSVIVSGRIAEDSYNKNGKLVYTVRNITFCTLPSDFRENRIIRKINDEFIAVQPQPYIKRIQSSLFETKKDVPSALVGKKFCVFDLETTGLSPEQNEIIEIGALIIEDGSIKETFSSFVSIENSVPLKITQLTGIDDSHLIGQPQLKDVLADFFKFCHGMPLVGQNVSFDYGFISVHGAKHHLYFDNERIDTITLARKYLRNMRNFTLKSIAEKLDIKNEEAHRALSDAVATAEIFIKLSNMS